MDAFFPKAPPIVGAVSFSHSLVGTACGVDWQEATQSTLRSSPRILRPGVPSLRALLRFNWSAAAMRVMPKQLTTHAPQLDICCLPYWWVYRQGDVVVTSCRGIVSRIDIISTAMHFGGRREWFKCPDCGDRARILYGPDFACRSCQQLNYPSTRRCSRDRAITHTAKSAAMSYRTGSPSSKDPMALRWCASMNPSPIGP
jgi:hypothetical protein